MYSRLGLSSQLRLLMMKLLVSKWLHCELSVVSLPMIMHFPYLVVESDDRGSLCGKKSQLGA